MHADEQGADARRAPALARQPAADDELLALEVLDLHPRARPAARLIRGVEPLGDDALETLRGAGLQHLPAGAHEVLGRLPVRSGELQGGEAFAALGVGEAHQRVAIQPQQVEDDVGDRCALRQPRCLRGRADVHAVLERSEARAVVLAEGDDLAVQDRAVRAERPIEPAQLGVGAGDVVEVAAVQLERAGLRVGDRAHAIPLDLIRPAAIVAGQLSGAGEHRLEVLGHRLAVRVRGRVHAVDHPVLGPGPVLGGVLVADGEQGVAGADTPAVQSDLDLARLPLQALIRSAIPDRHGAGAILALRDLAVEVDVRERVILGRRREVVFAGCLGKALGHRPGDEHPVSLQT